MAYGESSFFQAVYNLATSTCSLQRRVTDTCILHILPLYTPEIPRNPPQSELRYRENAQKIQHEWIELQDAYIHLRNQILANNQLSETSAVRKYLLNLSNEDSTCIAKQIFHLYHRYLTNPPEQRTITKLEAIRRLEALWSNLPECDQTEQNMFLFWTELHQDCAEVLNVRTKLRGDWQEVHCWLLDILDKRST